MKRRNGTTLIEVTAAILIAAMTSMAVFSVITSSTVSHVKSDKKEFSAAAVRMAQDRLKAYVTSDLTNTVISGPTANWHINGDTNAGWALAAGNHNISSWLNNDTNFDKLCKNSAGVSSCQFTYRVTDRNCGFGAATNSSCKQVVFTLIYPD
ncbi:MAG: hypothetical protein Fur0012_09940 [Elusimicrobiota bacterium]